MDHIIDIARKCIDKISVPDDKYKIVSGGRLYYEKGHLFLVHVLRTIIKRGLKEVILYIFGDGPFRPILEREIKKHNLQIKLLGKVPHEEALYIMYKADVVAVPSIYEIMPMIVLEALALRKPVVTLYANYIKEFTSTGIHIEASKSLTDMGLKIINILRNRDTEKLREVTERNYQILKKHFDISVTITRYIELYRTLIE